MPETRHLTPPPGATPEGKGRLPHGFHLGTHRHADGQLVYATAGGFATTTALGTWVAPADRVTWTPGAHRRLRAVVIDELACPPEQALHLPEPRDDRLRTATDLLHAEPARTTTLAELGRAAGASERTLNRLFQAELGMSFLRWRTILRIHHALVHLTEGRSVTDTAMACGWSNPSSFIDAFTEVVGRTPGRYQAGLNRPR
ncbi:AraC family transcriptional regulator [Amycolatopsis mediterranei]|uniref:helix-turn-helix transcriptional regulator n=1 Tax=Amycolatopsis mediterranei TaxID=33910 RepID=UPI003437869C